MNRESLEKLRLDRRLMSRRGWMSEAERQRALAALPDVVDKATTLGAESGEDESRRTDETPLRRVTPDPVIKSTVGKNLDVWIRRLFPFLFWWELDPNALTVTGALVSTAPRRGARRGPPTRGGLLILAGGFFDLVDGVVARHRGIATRFGAFLDSTLDRWVDAVLLVGVCVHFAREGAPQYVALAGLALAVTSSSRTARRAPSSCCRASRSACSSAPSAW
jgi:hypothetical protein